MSDRLVSAFLAPRETINFVYGEEREQAIYRRTSPIRPCAIVEPNTMSDHFEELIEVDVLFSTWGMPSLTAEQISTYFPRLKVLFYAAGSVQGFARPFIDHGVKIVSAWRANAVSVAHFTVAQIVLSSKGYFRNTREYDGSQETYRNAFSGRGAYGETVGLLGAGAIGKRVIELLKPYDFKVIVWDPFLSNDAAVELGVDKVASIDEVFSRSYVVSNHLADKDELAALIGESLLSSLRPDATFINTGRGRTVDQDALVKVLTARHDITALLDVTYPEPPGAGTPLMTLPNVHVSSHIAGTIGDEVRRMADVCIREFDRYVAGEPLEHEVLPELLATMA
ncbi:MAG TPA: hydroxyacid dehydrogenase [Capsulimonadaceae bacterium]|jgi:phosphoglycerate dehydrogenase-like enzyme